jgi:Tfp pilus assembly protein PilV
MAYGMIPPARQSPHAQAGFALIEVVVSALIVVMTTGAVLTLLNAGGKAGAEERHKAQAYALAQEDQARLRAMRIPDLLASAKGTAREVTIGGSKYTIRSNATFINNNSGVEPACEMGNSSSDYVRIASAVTWPKEVGSEPVRIQSTINPPNGSLDPTKGSLTVFVLNAQEVPISGVGLSSVSGPGTFTGTTNSNGCAQFSEQPAGNYEMRTSLSSGFVDENGNPPGVRKVGVVGAGSNSVTMLYNAPGVLKANFLAGETSIQAKAEALVLINNGMQAQTKTVWATGKTPHPSIEARSLFPFKAPYTAYGGACLKAIPEGDKAIASAAIIPGATTTISVRLPLLKLAVKNGSSAVPNATVTVHEVECPEAPSRSFTLGTAGTITEGLAWGKYEVCAAAEITETVNGKTQKSLRHASIAAEVKSTNPSSTLELQLTNNSPRESC